MQGKQLVEIQYFFYIINRELFVSKDEWRLIGI